MILGGDFNCVLSREDCTGAPHFSRALDLLVRSFDLQDAWSQTTNNTGYTNYTQNGAARLDRIYMSPNLRLKKTGIETVFVAFTDHLAVVVRIALDVQMIRLGKGRWMMNERLMEDETFRTSLQAEWLEWQQHKRRFPTPVAWWVQYVKKKIKLRFQSEGRDRARDRTTKENFYYACIYDIIRGTSQPREKMLKLQHLKAKIIRIHSEKFKSM